MKILICVVVFGGCGLFGYLYKRRLKQECDLVEFLLEFEKYYNSNMTLFKNNVVEIINNFFNLKKDSKAKFNQIIICNNSIFEANESELKKYITNESMRSVIKNYLNGLGKNDYEFEKEKNKNFEDYILTELSNSKKNLEQKGNLYFKLSLALGAVLCIIIW